MNDRTTIGWLLALGLTLALAGGCGNTAGKRVAADLAKGDQVALRLTQGTSGQMEVTGVDVESKNEKSEAGEVEDGSKEKENDGVACEQEGEHEGENQGCAPTQVVAGQVLLDASTGGARVLWLAVQLPRGAAVGNQFRRVTGTYGGDGLFTASTVSATAKATPRVMGVLEDMVKLDGGKLGLRVFGQTLPVDPRLKVQKISSLAQTIEQDTDGNTEKDGVICVQDGEHEGENEGC